jgi:hypothetical protein
MPDRCVIGGFDVTGAMTEKWCLLVRDDEDPGLEAVSVLGPFESEDETREFAEALINPEYGDIPQHCIVTTIVGPLRYPVGRPQPPTLRLRWRFCGLPWCASSNASDSEEEEDFTTKCKKI